MKLLFLVLGLLAGLATPSHAQQSAAADAEKEQFIYVLRPVPRLQVAENWSEEDSQAVGEHFRRLQRLTREGVVILAGRTQTLDASTFGIVIFEAPSAEDARRIMEEDPAVKRGIMTAELFPYAVALMRAPDPS